MLMHRPALALASARFVLMPGWCLDPRRRCRLGPAFKFRRLSVGALRALVTLQNGRVRAHRTQARSSRLWVDGHPVRMPWATARGLWVWLAACVASTLHVGLFSMTLRGYF